MKTNSAEKFLAIYNELDDYVRKQFSSEEFLDHSTLLRRLAEKNRLFSAYYKDLKMFAELRNYIVHNPYKNSADPLFEPHALVIEKYLDIKNQILNPQKAISIAVPKEAIYTTTLLGNALEVMQKMNDRTYTHVPVMQDNVMVGVFSENTILSYLVGKKDSMILQDTKIEEFGDFIPLEKHPSEFFEFVGRNALCMDVEELFRQGLKKRKRIAVVFITENGKKNEKLLGMLTAWDIAGKEIK